MSEKEKQLELLNRLFDAARGSLDEEWTDDCYVLADLITLVSGPRDSLGIHVIYEVRDTLVNTYKIPADIAIEYMKESPEFLENATLRMDEALNRELEEWIPSTDILTHQGEQDEKAD